MKNSNTSVIATDKLDFWTDANLHVILVSLQRVIIAFRSIPLIKIITFILKYINLLVAVTLLRLRVYLSS